MGFRQAVTSTLNNGFLLSEFPVSTIHLSYRHYLPVQCSAWRRLLYAIYHTVVKRTTLASTVPNWPIAIKLAKFSTKDAVGLLVTS